MTLCKYCGSKKVVKDGMLKGRQRYLCKECKRTSRCGDAREKYPIEKKIQAIKLYTEGMGMRSIERIEKVPIALLVHWFRNFGKMIREKLSAIIIPDNVKDIAILEADELFTYYQKKQKAYVWLVVDRDRNKVIDIVISKTREKWVFVRMAIRLERLGYRVRYLCTDGYEGYSSYSIAQEHIITKAETALVESKHSFIRHYLARFNRKTKRYSKAFDMTLCSLLILFNKRMLLSILT